MGLFNMLFNSATKKEGLNEVVDVVEASEQNLYGTLRIDRELCADSFMRLCWRNGEVKIGDISREEKNYSIIGSYKKTDEGNWEVFYEDTKIAYISPNIHLMQFMLAGKYYKIKEDYEKAGHSILSEKMVLPIDKLVWPAVKWDERSGMLFDYESGKVVANFDEDPIGAAATFAVWAYDIGEDNKYSNYFNLIFLR